MLEHFWAPCVKICSPLKARERGSPALPALWKWLCHSSYAGPAACAPVIDGSSRSIVTLLFLSMGILSGTPGLLSHWHPHKPITSFMLQVLSFEAAAPLFSLPQYSCFVHLWCCISEWVALCSQLLPHHKAGEQQGFANQQISISDLSYLLLFCFWPWLLQVYLQNTPSLSSPLWFREARDSLTEFLVWTLDTAQRVLMQ